MGQPGLRCGGAPVCLAGNMCQRRIDLLCTFGGLKAPSRQHAVTIGAIGLLREARKRRPHRGQHHGKCLLRLRLLNLLKVDGARYMEVIKQRGRRRGVGPRCAPDSEHQSVSEQEDAYGSTPA